MTAISGGNRSEPLQELLAVLAVGVAIVLIYLLLRFLWYSSPISIYCLGSLAAGGVVSLAAKIAEEANPKPERLSEKLIHNVLEDGKRTLFAFTIGSAIAWIAQVVLQLGSFSPDAVGDFQIRIYEISAQLGWWMSLPVLIGLALFALALSLSLNALWPLGLLGKTRKWLGKLVGVLTVLVGFGFVGVQANAPNYAPQARQIRAQIVGDLQTIIDARKRAAALQWLGAELQSDALDAKQAAIDHAYFAKGVGQCETAQGNFEQGYRRNGGSYYSYDSRQAAICRPSAYITDLAKRMVRTRPVRQQGAPDTAWIPEFARLTQPAAAPSETTASGDDQQSGPRFDLRGDLWRYADLTELSKRVAAQLDDAEKARGVVEGAASKLVADRVGATVKAYVPEIMTAWLEPFIGAVAEEGVAKISRRLKRIRVPLPSAAAALAGLETAPPKIDSASAQVRRDGSLAATLKRHWLAHLRVLGRTEDLDPASPEIADLGAKVAQRDEARRKEQDAWNAKMAKFAAESRARAESYRAHEVRIP